MGVWNYICLKHTELQFPKLNARRIRFGREQDASASACIGLDFLEISIFLEISCQRQVIISFFLGASGQQRQTVRAPQ